jgi:cytochrome c-type biogenesis protein CcmF
MSFVALNLPKKALGIFGVFQIYFLALLYFKASPFIQMPYGNFQGRGINPLLEDSALLYHPPILYMGYILIFAAISIILSQIELTKKWVVSSWVFLTLGLISGSFWAFYEVGWGGWWFWDAVENIALIPWLLLLGAMHIAHQKESFYFKLLIFLSFVFAFLGVFTVRMGLIRSIHNFTQSSDNLGFLIAGVCLIVTSFQLLRLPSIRPPGVMNIPGILGIFFAILIGVATFFPLFSSFEVGSDYYTKAIAPLFLIYPIALIFVMISKDKMILCLAPLILGSIFIMLLILYEKFYFIPFILILSFICILGICVWIESKSTSSVFSHTGFLIFLTGVSFNHFLQIEKEVTLSIHESTSLMGKAITLNKIDISQTQNYKSEIAHIKWEDTILYPERRYYKNYDIIRPKTDFSLGLFSTHYVYIVDRVENGWIIKVQYHPLISWIWMGGILMALGGILSLRKRR